MSADSHSVDRPIAVGDLVMVVRGHACGIGKIFTVRRFGVSLNGYRCIRCKKEWKTPDGVPDIQNDVGAWYELHRLKRIPPLGELEGVKTDEPIEEPA